MYCLHDNVSFLGDLSESVAKLIASGETAAMRALMEKIEKSTERNVYRRFMDALRGSGKLDDI